MPKCTREFREVTVRVARPKDWLVASARTSDEILGVAESAWSINWPEPDQRWGKKKREWWQPGTVGTQC